MTPDEVAEIIGAPSAVSNNTRGERSETRHGITVRYGDTGVVEFAFLPESSVLLHGVDLFECSDPIDALLEVDPCPMECLGFLLFLGIGIAITGFHDGDASQKALTTFGSFSVQRIRF